MNADSYHKKQIYFKAYKHLLLLDNDLNLIKEARSKSTQISILGQVDKFHNDMPILKDLNSIKFYWEKALGDKTDFGDFYNPKIGNIFIVGTLKSTFLQRINNKSLGMLSAGPYGILRGIGASEAQATDYLKQLNMGSYLLIIRAFGEEIEKIKDILKQE